MAVRCDFSSQIELLAHATGMDSGEVPAGLLDAAKLCGRLPLTLTIAGQLIAEAGEAWCVYIVLHRLRYAFLIVLCLFCFIGRKKCSLS